MYTILLKSSTSDPDQKDFKLQELKYKYLYIFRQDAVLCISAVTTHKPTRKAHPPTSLNFNAITLVKQNGSWVCLY